MAVDFRSDDGAGSSSSTSRRASEACAVRRGASKGGSGSGFEELSSGGHGVLTEHRIPTGGDTLISPHAPEFLFVQLFAFWQRCRSTPPCRRSKCRATRYGFSEGTPPALELSREGEAIFRLPVVSGLTTGDKQEALSNIRASELEPLAGGGYRLKATADSSLWRDRRFEWSFYPDRIEFQQFATGNSPIERCFFFSNGVSERWANGTSPGVAANTTILAGRYFSPGPEPCRRVLPHDRGAASRSAC